VAVYKILVLDYLNSELNQGKHFDFDNHKYEIFYSDYSDSRLFEILVNSSIDCLLLNYPKVEFIEKVISNIQIYYPHLPILLLTPSKASLPQKITNYIHCKQLSLVSSVRHTLEVTIDEMISLSNSLQKHKNNLVLVLSNNFNSSLNLCKAPYVNYSLEHENFNFTSLEAISTHRPSLVVVNIKNLKDEHLNFIKGLRALYPRIKIIILSDNNCTRSIVKAIKSGADDYLISSQITAFKLNVAICDLLSCSIEQGYPDDKELLIKSKEQLLKKEAELENTSKFQDLIIESMPEYLFVKNERFELVKFNTAFKELYPTDIQEKIIGKTTLEDYPESEVEEFLKMDKLAFKQGYSETYETITFPSGIIRILFTTKTRFKNSSGESFILGISRDVTEKEQAIKQLVKSNQDLEQFAYIASHDLRSPLNAILKLVEWIKEDNLNVFDTSTLEKFELIQGRALRMSKLLDDLLSYSRLNKVQHKPEAVNLVDEKLSILDLVMTDKKINIHFPNLTIVIPKLPLQLVLLNLINNSIKHSDKKEVRVELLVSQKPGGLELIIKDNGPGINFKYSDKIFEMFQTLKSRDEVEGSGMGLSIIKKVIEFHCGEITLVNQSNGAEFKIFWPQSFIKY
jgi:PAS domain S-box-containing protein